MNKLIPKFLNSIFFYLPFCLLCSLSYFLSCFLFMGQAQGSDTIKSMACNSFAYSETNENFQFVSQEQLRLAAATLIKLELSLNELNSNMDSEIIYLVRITKLAKFKKEFKEFLNLAGEQGLAIYEAEEIRQLAREKNQNVDDTEKRRSIIDKDKWLVIPWKIKHIYKSHFREVTSVQFSLDNRIIVTASDDQTANYLDAVTGEVYKSFKGHDGRVNSAELSPNRKTLVTSSNDGTAKLWNLLTGDVEHTFTAINAANAANATKPLFYSAHFSPDGKYIVIAASDSTAKIYEVSTSKLLSTLRGHAERVRSAQFSPDGKFILTTSEDKTAKLWEFASGKAIQTFTGHSDWVKAGRFSADGKYVLTASDDHTAKLWEAITGRLLKTFNGHENQLNSAEFSPGGKTIITTSVDKTIKLWNIANGELIQTLTGHKGGVNSAQFSTDGKLIVSGSADDTVIIWEQSEDGFP